MVEKYKIPKDPLSKDADFENFTIDSVLKNLAFNKHNETTTTYYLLHKKWITSVFKEARRKAKVEAAGHNPLFLDSQDEEKQTDLVSIESKLITLTA
jgi:hypothetical protein